MAEKRMKKCIEDGCDRMITRNATRCGSCSKKGSIPWNRGIQWSHSTDRQKGIRNHQWKGESAGYQAVHMWLSRNFGKADHCEHCGLTSEQDPRPKRFHWAKIHGLEYAHKRENFFQLCVSCHNHYDCFGNALGITPQQYRNLAVEG
jgi:hypothetical protein